MSEQPTQVPVRGHYRTVGGDGADEPGAGPGEAPPQQGGFFTGQMIRGVPNWALIAGAALLAVGIFMWYRSRKSATTAQTQAASPATTVAGTTSSTAGQCYDASGNAVPCTQADYASQIAALQAEIDNIQGTASVPAASTGTTTAPTATAQAVQPAVGSTQSAGTSTPVTTSAGAG